MSKKKTTYEENIKKLEEVTNKIESGELPLEQTISLFEEGMKMAKECQQFLDQAELKINKLINGEEEKTEDFSPE